MLAKAELAAIKARAEMATDGPWEEVGENGEFWMYSDFEGERESTVIADTGCSQFRRQEDVDFIAHSRSDIPALLAHIEELEAVADEAVEMGGFRIIKGDRATDGEPWIDVNAVGDFASQKPHLTAYLKQKEQK